MLRCAVILPMYNEAGNVHALLERLATVRSRSGIDLVALAVDDGSRDDTYGRLVSLSSVYPFVRIERHTRNQGMAAALRTGIASALNDRSAAFEALAFMDADLTHAPEDLPRLIAPIDEGRADFVLGSRYVPGGRMRGVPFARRLISVVGNAAVRQLLHVPVRDLTRRLSNDSPAGAGLRGAAGRHGQGLPSRFQGGRSADHARRAQERLFQDGLYPFILARLRAPGGAAEPEATCGRLACPNPVCRS
jgi:glycosyltransferase involved in cell wall biosynthesis